jgi:ABC-2 type transport system permease protein
MTTVLETTPEVRRESGRPAPMGRLTVIELRKLADTRAGFWLLLVIALASVATAVLLLFFGAAEDQRFETFYLFGLVPAGILLPVLGILSMTGEWSQRTALTTFALVPARGRVVVAKLLASTAIAVLATVTIALTAAAGNLAAIALDGDGSWHISAESLAQGLLLQVIFLLMGSAFGALLMNSAVSIVLFFALPLVWSVLGELVRPLRRAAEWLDINLTTAPLAEVGLTGAQWSRLGVSVVVWVLLPLVAGTFRVLRREVA